MTKFSETNFRLLRVTKTRALQLMLLLSKQDVEWFTDVTFQQVLTMLQPLIEARVEYFIQGVPSKQLQPQRPTRTGSAMVARAVAAAKAAATTATTPPASGSSSPAAAASSPSSTLAASRAGAGSSSSGISANQRNEDELDGLEDLGMVLGGDVENEPAGIADNTNSSGTTGRPRPRRQRGIKAATVTPRFRVRFGFRDHQGSDRGGDGAMSVLVKKQNLEFKIKNEEQEDKITVDGVRILQEEEDEDALARRLLASSSSSLSPSQVEDAEDAEAMERRKRARLSGKETSSGSGGHVGSESKPTLEVTYQPLRMLPMTLYITIRTEPEASSSNPFTVAAAAAPPPEENDDLLPAALVHS